MKNVTALSGKTSPHGGMMRDRKTAWGGAVAQIMTATLKADTVGFDGCGQSVSDVATTGDSHAQQRPGWPARPRTEKYGIQNQLRRQRHRGLILAGRPVAGNPARDITITRHALSTGACRSYFMNCSPKLAGVSDGTGCLFEVT